MVFGLGAIWKTIKGIRKNKKLDKLIYKLKEIDAKNICNLVSDREYAQIYIGQLEYFDLKKKQASAKEIINKNIELIKRMEEYINKQREVLSRENATQLDVAKLVSSLQKLQLRQDCFAAGIIECDDNLNELSIQIENVENYIQNMKKEIPNISNQIVLIQHRYIEQDRINYESKEAINRVLELGESNVKDLKNEISILNGKIECDDNLNELSIQIENIENYIQNMKKEIPNISNQIVLIQHRYIEQDRINYESKEAINRVLELGESNVKDLKNEISILNGKIIDGIKLLEDKHDKLYLEMNAVREQIVQSNTIIRKEISDKSIEMQKKVEIQNVKISTIENNINCLGKQIIALDRVFYENKREVDAKFISYENMISVMVSNNKKQMFRIKICMGIFFVLVLIFWFKLR